MTERGTVQPARRHAAWHVLSVSLAAAAVVLWAFSGWTWWAAVPLIGGLIVVRLPLALFPPLWRPWASQWGVVALALFVVLWLTTLVSARALGVAAGVAGLVLTWYLRTVLQPRWLPWAAAGLATALVLGCGLAEWLVWRAEAEQRAQDAQVAHEYQVAKLRPDSPVKALNWMLRDLAYDDSRNVCWLFTDRGRRQFAAAVGAPSCEAAVHQLHDQIDPERRGLYGDATVPTEDVTQTDHGAAYLTACRMYVLDGFEHAAPPGPALGTLTLEPDPQYDFALLITGYAPCGQDPPGVPSREPEAPAVLPSYPPAFGALLTKAIAHHDTEVCTYFTDRGRQQLAAAVGATSCEDAIEMLAQEVTDPDAYATPSNTAPAAAGRDGHVTVDVCHLRWTTSSTRGGVTPGPQLGHLGLTQPNPDEPGYLVDGFRRC